MFFSNVAQRALFRNGTSAQISPRKFTIANNANLILR